MAMTKERVSRRDFIGKSVAGIATVAATGSIAKASSASAADRGFGQTSQPSARRVQSAATGAL